MQDRNEKRSEDMSKILLLEDDLSLANGLSFAFRKEGFTPDAARTIAEADALWGGGKYGGFLPRWR